MAVIRVEKDRNYTVMSNTHLRDKRISLKAKGLLSQMLSLPDDWDYSVYGLTAINQEGEKSITSTLNELKLAGYVEVRKLLPNETKSGRYQYEYVVHERSIEKQDPQNRGVVTGGLKQGACVQGVENKGVVSGVYINNGDQLTEKRNTDTGNKEIRARSAFETQIEAFTANEELRQSLRDFVEHRKQIRKPLSENAMKLLLKKLGELSGNAGTQIEILQQSIINGWAGVFSLKRDSNRSSQDTWPRGYQEEPKRIGSGQTIL